MKRKSREPCEAEISYELDLYVSKIQAGFPSPADDGVQGKLDLNRHLIKNPPATFFVRATGESMLQAGIHPDDILVVDRSLPATHGRIVVAVLDGELTVKRLHIRGERRVLRAESAGYADIPIGPEADFRIWGVVTYVVHAV